MAPITVTTEVNRSAGDVFSYATDRTHFSELQNGVEGYIEAAPTGSGRNGSQRGESAWPIAPQPPKSPRSIHLTHGASVRGFDGSTRAAVDVSVFLLPKSGRD
jgi:hypothetical protein